MQEFDHEKLDAFKEEWFDFIFHSGQDLKETDITKDVEWLYNFLKLKVPPVYVSDSYKTFRDKIKEVAGDDAKFSEVGLAHDNWLLEYACFENAGLIKNEDFKRYVGMMRKGIFTMAIFDEALFICKLPVATRLDDQQRLHSATAPAIEWRDGQKIFAIRGVSFDEELWTKVTKKTLTAKEILGLSNIEQRYIALDLYGYENLLEELDAKLLDKSDRGNELYTVAGLLPNGQETKFVKYQCPSTGRKYASMVPVRDQSGYDMNNADHAMAWKFNLTPEQYKKLKIEA